MISQQVPEFADALDHISGCLEADIPHMLDAARPLVLDNIVENFARQETPDGIAWPARKVEGDGHPLLVETATEGSGSLMAAATGQASGHVNRIEGDTLIIGVDKEGGVGGIPGAGVHNYGYEPFNIPQREFLGIGDATADLIGDVIAERALREILGE